MARYFSYQHIAIKQLTDAFYRQVHSATRSYIYRVTGSRRGTSNSTPLRLMNAFEREYATQIKKNITKAVGHLQKELKRTVNEPYPPASLPGQPPHKRTGIGQASIRRRLVRNAQADFMQLIWLHPMGWYMAELEVGINLNSMDPDVREVQPRPWLEPTIKRESRTLDRILRKGF